MAKKKKKSTSTRRTKKAPKPSPQDKKEAERILKIWRDAAKVGLGGKRFAKIITARYEPRLRERILFRLVDKKDVFDKKAEAKTKTVAHDTGVVCAMLTKGSEVSKDTFQDVFFLLKRHVACPRKLHGAGTWCDIQL